MFGTFQERTQAPRGRRKPAAGSTQTRWSGWGGLGATCHRLRKPCCGGWFWRREAGVAETPDEGDPGGAVGGQRLPPDAAWPTGAGHKTRRVAPLPAIWASPQGRSCSEDASRPQPLLLSLLIVLGCSVTGLSHPGGRSRQDEGAICLSLPPDSASRGWPWGVGEDCGRRGWPGPPSRASRGGQLWGTEAQRHHAPGTAGWAEALGCLSTGARVTGVSLGLSGPVPYSATGARPPPPTPPAPTKPSNVRHGGSRAMQRPR